jgi:hypothetical protein
MNVVGKAGVRYFWYGENKIAVWRPVFQSIEDIFA